MINKTIDSICFFIEQSLDHHGYKHDKIEILDKVIIYASKKKHEIKKDKKI